MKVSNIVISGKFSNVINLRSIPNCVYRPERFSGGVIGHCNCTFLLFTNGSFVCLGATSKAIAANAIKSLGKFLNSKILKCGIKNMVMSHKVKFEIDLIKLYEMLRKLKKYVVYEDELFNGIVWKDNGGTIRLFHNGSFFVTGLRSVHATELLCRDVCRFCWVCKK